MAESIYNIIPKEYVPPPKEQLYKSKFPPNIKPTATTFCNRTTSKPLVYFPSCRPPITVENSPRDCKHTLNTAILRPLGMLREIASLLSKTFWKNKQGRWVIKLCLQVFFLIILVRNFSYDCKHKKDSVPKVTDKPVQGLKSNKNFIVTNAIENILSNAKKVDEPIDWQKKKDFGKTPEYLNRIK